jgi:NAD(P)H dehydrogenase (quinone)
MQVLLVVAHPSSDSLTQAAANTAIAALRANGHHVDVLDLYAIGYRASLSAEERHAYHGDHPIVEPVVAEHVALLQQAEALVFCYPTWWSSLPAILKAWFERTMVPGVGFVFNDKGKVRPGLRQVRRIVGISTYGSKFTYVKVINDNGRRIVQRTLRSSCGRQARTSWVPLYAVDTTTPEQRADFLRRIEQRMAKL